jgi:hypothetical protein
LDRNRKRLARLFKREFVNLSGGIRLHVLGLYWFAFLVILELAIVIARPCLEVNVAQRQGRSDSRGEQSSLDSWKSCPAEPNWESALPWKIMIIKDL